MDTPLKLRLNKYWENYFKQYYTNKKILPLIILNNFDFIKKHCSSVIQLDYNYYYLDEDKRYAVYLCSTKYLYYLTKKNCYGTNIGIKQSSPLYKVLHNKNNNIIQLGKLAINRCINFNTLTSIISNCIFYIYNKCVLIFTDMEVMKKKFFRCLGCYIDNDTVIFNNQIEVNQLYEYAYLRERNTNLVIKLYKHIAFNLINYIDLIDSFINSKQKRQVFELLGIRYDFDKSRSDLTDDTLVVCITPLIKQIEMCSMYFVESIKAFKKTFENILKKKK